MKDFICNAVFHYYNYVCGRCRSKYHTNRTNRHISVTILNAHRFQTLAGQSFTEAAEVCFERD